MRENNLSALRTERRLWGFNQEELALLVGVRGAAQICRLESGERVPPFSVALAIEILFDMPAGGIFIGIREEVEERLMTQVYGLHQRLLPIATAKAERKRQLLEQVLSRGVDSLKRNARV